MIVTFYSFKGGVGRSMALANIARWFQVRGLNVVMVDWDLEAPGLETFFSRDAAVLRSWRDRVGLTDLLLLYRQDYPAIPFDSVDRQRLAAAVRASEPLGTTALESGVATIPAPPALAAPEERWSEIVADAARLRELLPPLKFSLIDIPPPTSAQGAGRLRLLTAGWREGARFSAYANAVQGFDWNDFYASYHGHAYFEWLRNSLDDPEVADIVFVDSRTGVTEMGGVSTRQLADVVVVLTAPNRQNIDGAIQMADSFEHPELMEQRGKRPIQVIMVPSRVDVSATDVKKEFEDEFKKRANEFMPDELQRLERDFWDLRIPYVSKFAFQERLSIGETDGDPDLDASYKSIASHIAWLASDTSRIKNVMVDEFERVFGRERVRRALDFGAQFDQRWREIPAELESDVQELLLRLVEVSATKAEPDRARVVLETQLERAFRSAIDKAVDARLIVRVASETRPLPVLTLSAPEYVTRSLLARWIDDDRQFLVWRQRLRVFLDDWQSKRRDPGSLLQGSALLEAADMAADAHDNELLDDEREFIEASMKAVHATPAETTAAFAVPAPAPSASRTARPDAAERPLPAAPSRKRSLGMWVAAASVLVLAAAGAYTLLATRPRGSVNLVPTSFADSMAAGEKHADAGEYGQAIVAYTAALRIDPRSVEALRSRALARAAAGRPNEALTDLDTALTLARTDTRLHAQRAKVLLLLGDTSRALTELGGIPVDSMDNATLRLRADIFSAQGKDSAALGAYTVVVQRGDTAAGQLGRGRALERLGRTRDAVQAYRSVTTAATDPSMVTFAQARLRVLAPGATTVTTPKTPIYLQFLSASDVSLARSIDSSLKAIGLSLESDARGRNYQVVDTAKTDGEIRYVGAAEETLAERVRHAVEGALSANGIYRPLATRLVVRSGRAPRQVEIWLPPLGKALPTQQAPLPSSTIPRRLPGAKVPARKP